MPTNHFKLNTFLDHEEEVFHVARTTINSKNDLQLHRHGFCEIFWVKEGSCIHLVNKQELPLEKGCLCLIRPEDQHTFKLNKSQESMVITNIAFFQDSLDYFKDRYFRNSSNYFWSEDQQPFTIQLDSDQLNELSAITDRLIGQARNSLHLDYLMIQVFRMINCLEESQNHIPAWLAYALENYNTPNRFKKGVQGFVELTERSVDHVNRILKEHLKQTLSETVIKARLQYASQQLIMTNSSIKSICYDCGFESVSYFYRLFKKHMHQTPVEYRGKNRKIF
ncbi:MULTISPECIES: AraC family transcriptional regulator [unclassified Lentimicrobium]|uniref:AraC family transcriptional regulator n=1 Tax=unclassified Lentimicrobium TaxID=2677434 RepID=UPI001556B356|nr:MULTISPECIES: AraC family transcriptional regulator [unclassified Lentimicrobium]NPD43972.1 AraC family transcriptional regulator [Lentimicrobium sp. S6]NPD84114.1 AraC family transcriptional regulator [Lentimicrobium sp. L6]